MSRGAVLDPFDPNTMRGITAIVGGSSNIPFGVPVKYATASADITDGRNTQIPRVIQCTSSTDDGFAGFLFPDPSVAYAFDSTNDYFYAAADDRVILVYAGIINALVDSAATIDTTGATYGGFVSPSTNGVASTAAGDYTCGKIILEATGYNGSLKHRVKIQIMNGMVAGHITGKTNNLQNLTGNGAITFTTQFNTCKLTKNTSIAATLADGTAADIGKIVVVFDNGTGAAHTITTSSTMINGIFNTATLGGVKGNFVAFQWTGIHWATLGGEGVVFTVV